MRVNAWLGNFILRPFEPSLRIHGKYYYYYCIITPRQSNHMFHSLGGATYLLVRRLYKHVAASAITTMTNKQAMTMIPAGRKHTLCVH